MLFKRKEKLSFWNNIKRFLWPESGFRRALGYMFLRLVRLPGSVHGISAGVASGVAVSFTPFLGLHFLMGFALAWITRGNLLASAIGTAVGNPWTFPFIFILIGSVGEDMLGVSDLQEISAFSFNLLWASPSDYLLAYIDEILVLGKPYVIGSIPTALTVWFLTYGVMKLTLETHFEKVEARKAAKRSEKEEIGDEE